MLLHLIDFNDDEDISFSKSKPKAGLLIGQHEFINEIKNLITEYVKYDYLSDLDREKLQDLFNTFNSAYKNGPYEIKYTINENDDLEDIIKKILEFCPFDVNLNWIDTSNVTDMSNVFNSTNFNGNISEWNTAKVTTMARMFRSCPFNGNIGNWNVNLVEDMSFMFHENKNFNQDLSNWNTAKVKTMLHMALGADQFNKNSVVNWNYKRCRDKDFIFNRKTINKFFKS